MAITQQLARLTAEQLDLCTASVEALDAVCSFTALEDRDYLDLDWYPNALEAAANEAGAEQRLTAALKVASRGRTEVNPAYREVPDSVFEHPVNYLSPEEVVSVWVNLHRLAEMDFVSGRREPEGLEDAFLALLGFYAEAATRGLAIVMWWD